MKRQLFYLRLIIFVCGLIPNSNIYSQVGVLDYTRKIRIKGKIIEVPRTEINEGAEETLTAKEDELATSAVKSAKRIILKAAAEQGIVEPIPDQELSNAAQQIISDILKERTILREATRKITLTQAPNSWGKRIPNSSGKAFYYDNFQGVFSGGIELGGLTPNHGYFLSLNGKPPHPSGLIPN